MEVQKTSSYPIPAHEAERKELDEILKNTHFARTLTNGIDKQRLLFIFFQNTSKTTHLPSRAAAACPPAENHKKAKKAQVFFDIILKNPKCSFFIHFLAEMQYHSRKPCTNYTVQGFVCPLRVVQCNAPGDHTNPPNFHMPSLPNGEK
ncbi:uncharacterized protein TM35_000401190 [Trypanosoma theileri]|uniref:Uncharacterized protein n=1 Tax=Trypanosoma theileri TaxID=67003 RepID=A0A1X0NJC2_9TRYP|nr:uncharacterized protein TM35_000401190 [Trypanosoma theileri]ORC84852.1 hypothetical protein TM35_000401190 [Trypanosoma theileri]